MFLSKTNVVLIFASLLISLALRFYWFYIYGNNELFFYDNTPLIVSPDGYFWLECAKEYLSDGPIPYYAALSKVTAIIYQLSPFSLEQIAFYMPAFAVIISIIAFVLIGKELNNPSLGFAASVFALCMPEFYERTTLGYFDDDMFSLQMPIWILYACIRLYNNQSLKNSAFLFITVVLYQWLYPKSFYFSLALFTTLLLYSIKEKRFLFPAFGVLAALCQAPIYIKSLVFIALFINFKFASILCITMFLFFNDFARFFALYETYAVKTYSAFSLGGVSESVRISPKIIIDKIALNIWIFTLSIVGFLLLLRKYKAFIFALPLISISIFAFWGGQKFAAYSAPLIGFGLAYAIIYLATLKINRILSASVVILCCTFLFLELFNHIAHSQQKPFLDTKEAKAMAAINATDKAYGWWDYGYAVKYYSNLTPVTDGARQNIQGSIAEAKILTSVDATQAATLMGNNAYLILPLKLMNIMPTIYKSIDTNSTRRIFLGSHKFSISDNKITMGAALSIETTKAFIAGNEVLLKRFISINNDVPQEVHYNPNGDLSVIFNANSNYVLLLDEQSFLSMFIQMGVLGVYDDSIFSLVSSNSKIKIYVTKR